MVGLPLTISVNLAFYPFAFDMLRVTAKGWGMMITAYYGASLLAMFIAGQMDVRSERRRTPTIYLASRSSGHGLLLCIFKNIWDSVDPSVRRGHDDSSRRDHPCGHAARLFPTGNYMARVTAFSDLMAVLGKLAGNGRHFVYHREIPFIDVFVTCGILMLIFAINGISNMRGSRPTEELPRVSRYTRGCRTLHFVIDLECF